MRAEQPAAHYPSTVWDCNIFRILEEHLGELAFNCAKRSRRANAASYEDHETMCNDMSTSIRYRL